MQHPVIALTTQAHDFWFARAAVVVIVALQLLTSNTLHVGPGWLAPVVEVALLIPLSIATGWAQGSARKAHTDTHLHIVLRTRRAIRWLAFFLTIVVSLFNFGALLLLIRALISGHAGAAPVLLLDAANIWGTNIIIFALWYWNLDRGGPAASGLVARSQPDFLFANMLQGASAETDWSPGFIDYLYLSFTNATAFSPTDTLPLSQMAKVLMMFEASISLLTVALVAARAVNVLS